MYYKDINLLPQKQNKVNFGKMIISFLMVILVLSIAGEYIVVSPLNRKKQLQEELNILTDKIAAFGTISDDYLELIKKNQEYNEKTAKLKEVLNYSYKPTMIVDRLQGHVDGTVIIQDFKFNSSAVSISCLAKDYESVGKFIERLNADEMFSSARYDSIAFSENVPVKFYDENGKVAMEYVNAYSFNVSIILKGK